MDVQPHPAQRRLLTFLVAFPPLLLGGAAVAADGSVENEHGSDAREASHEDGEDGEDGGVAPQSPVMPLDGGDGRNGDIGGHGDAREREDGAAMTSSPEQRAFLRTSLNGLDLGDLLVLLRDKDVWLRVADLERAGLRLPSGTREQREGSAIVSLASLAPFLSFTVDDESLALLITAAPSLFGTTAMDLRPGRPPRIIDTSNPSLFVNYQLSAADVQSRGSTALGAFAESGLSLGGGLLYGSAQYNSNPASNYDRLLTNASWVRLMTNATFDWRRNLVRVVAGDTQATMGDVLGGGAILGGLGITRTFSLDPYFVFLPTMQLAGTAMTPSTVEVYVNGQLVRREPLAPGQFDLKNVPLTSGSGETKVVVRDAFGGQKTMVSPYYLALGTLAKGLSDFSYNLGFVRQGYGTDTWNYGQLALLFRHRVGVTDWLTVGGRAEATTSLLSAGVHTAFRLRKGELGAAAAVSAHDAGAGSAGMLSYSYVGRPFLAQVGTQWKSDRYVNLSLGAMEDRQRLDILATAAATIARVATVALQYEGGVWRRYRSRQLLRSDDPIYGDWTDRVTLRCNRNLTRWLYAFLTTTTTLERGRATGFESYVGLTFALAERTTLSTVRADQSSNELGYRGGTQATLQQSLPVGSGLGYRLTLGQGDRERNDALVQYQGAYGRVEAQYQHDGYATDDRGHASIWASGGMVLIGGRPYVTRQVQDGFALIRVPGVSGVQGLVSNQVVGRTNGHGDLLVPSLLSYYGNRIGIDHRDIPLDHEIGATELTIAPPFRGGAIVTFPVRRVLAVSGAVVVDAAGGPVVPAYGQLAVTVDGQSIRSPIDEAGNFYLENVPPGSYAAEVDYAEGGCTFSLVVRKGATSLVNVGTARCRQRALKGAKP